MGSLSIARQVKKTKRGCAITFDSSDEEEEVEEPEKEKSEVERTPEQTEANEDEGMFTL